MSPHAWNVHIRSPSCFQNNSVSPSESLRASEKHRSSAEYSMEAKKRKAEEKDSLSRYVCVRVRWESLALGCVGPGVGEPPGLSVGESERHRWGQEGRWPGWGGPAHAHCEHVSHSQEGMNEEVVLASVGSEGAMGASPRWPDNSVLPLQPSQRASLLQGGHPQ